MKLPAQLRPLADEIRRNPRLQLGGVLIVALVVGWLFLVLGDWRQAKLADLAQAHQRLDQVRELAGQEAWLERAEDAASLVRTLEAEIPPVASPGLAQADFQGWLRELVNAQGANLRLDVQSPTELDQPADVVRVNATISGGMPPGRVVQLINRIEGRSALTTIPTLIIRSDGANQTFSLTVQGYYRLGSAGAAP